MPGRRCVTRGENFAATEKMLLGKFGVDDMVTLSNFSTKRTQDGCTAVTRTRPGRPGRHSVDVGKPYPTAMRDGRQPGGRRSSRYRAYAQGGIHGQRL